MNLSDEQGLILAIVETWNPSETPKYRGFRCANCQEYRNKAWYHWLYTGGYRMPIHMCDETCEKAFQAGLIAIDDSKRTEVNRKSFGTDTIYNINAVTKFREITASWPDYKEPELKSFTCDACDQDLDIDPIDNIRKGFHVWWKMDDGKTLSELHFHRTCASKLGIE
jgi:hypothetical protein